MLLDQSGEMRTDGNAAACLPYDPPNQVALPPPQPALRKSRAMLGDDKRNVVAPLDRQRQHAGIQAAMRMHQIRPSIVADVPAEQFYPAPGPGDRIAVRNPRHRGKIIAPVDRHAVTFDSRTGTRLPLDPPGSQIAPGVDVGRQDRDAMTGGLERQGLVAKIAPARPPPVRVPGRDHQDVLGQARVFSAACSARCSAKTLLATISDSRMIGTPT